MEIAALVPNGPHPSTYGTLSASNHHDIPTRSNKDLSANSSSNSSSSTNVSGKLVDPYDSSDSGESADAGSQTPENRRMTWMSDHVAVSTLLEAELLMLTFCTGLMDTLMFSTYQMFATKQTGNVIFLMLSLLDVEGANNKPPVNLAISIGAFILGAILQGQAGNVCGCRRRVWLVTASLLSTAPLYTAAVIQRRLTLESRLQAVSAGKEGLGTGLWVVGLCAASYGSQFALSLSTRGAELNTSVVTSAMVNLSSDARLMRPRNPNRDRRAFFILSIAAGAMVGAGALKLVGPAAGILLAAVCRTCVGLLFLLNPSDGTPDAPMP